MPSNKPNITPGQGLILLMQQYQDDPYKLEELKVLYLCGASTPEKCIALCTYLIEEPLLASFEITIDERSINADPTRRYFETHLAYETLKHQLDAIELKTLRRHYRYSAALVDQDISEGKRTTINQTFKGECVDPSFNVKTNTTFSAYIKRIKEQTIFNELSEQDREKIKWLTRINYMGLVNSWRHTEMPINIYRTHSLYLKRGKISALQDQASTRSQHFGLLKSYMPLPRNDIAVSIVPFTHIKPSETSTFDSDSEVIQSCFQQLVHPYSNSTSGVLLTQLRVLAKLQQDDLDTEFTESLANFIQLMRLLISSSLYYSGGHSLYEYAFLFTIPEVQEAFQTIPGFDSLDLETLFYQENEEAFDTALHATLEYTTQLLARKAVHQQLHGFFGSSKIRPSPVSVTNPHLDMFTPIKI